MTTKEAELTKLLCNACKIIDTIGQIELMEPPLASWYFTHFMSGEFQEIPSFDDPGDSQ
ncbi:MAG: hypothetical protein V3R57_06335 [Candidatus Bathyarchaeia archaeon]